MFRKEQTLVLSVSSSLFIRRRRCLLPVWKPRSSQGLPGHPRAWPLMVLVLAMFSAWEHHVACVQHFMISESHGHISRFTSSELVHVSNQFVVPSLKPETQHQAMRVGCWSRGDGHLLCTVRRIWMATIKHKRVWLWMQMWKISICSVDK